MTFLASIRKAVNRALIAVKAFYDSHWDAAKPSITRYGRRPWRYGRVPDPREVQTPQSRLETIRIAQGLERNNALARRLATLYVTYAVGSGLPVRPASSDEDWNGIRKGSWDRWCETPDVASVQTFDSFQVMCAWRTFFDGAGYIFKTRGDVPPYRPRVQFIEAANIQTPPSLAARSNIHDGKETDDRGRITFYYVRECINGVESFKKVPADRIIPICDFERPGDLHAYSYLAAVLNDLLDLEDLCDLAMDKAKEIAELKLIFNTENGELPDGEARRQENWDEEKVANDDSDYTEEQIQDFEKKMGGKIISLRNGESATQIGAQAPNEIDREHWKLIAARICAGCNIPMQLVFPESVQGTVARGTLDDFANYANSQWKVFSRAFLEVYRWVTGEEMRFDASISDVPRGFDYWKATIRPPKSPNVDPGRAAAATLAMLDAGATTYDEIYSPLGLDPEEQLWKAGRYAALIRRIATELKITPGEIRQSAGEAIKLMMEKEAATQAANQAADDAAAQRQQEAIAA